MGEGRAEVRLGGARFEQVTVGAYDTLDVDGVLGYNVLRYTGFTLDYPGQRLILHRRGLPPADGVTTFSYEVIDRLPFVCVCQSRRRRRLARQCLHAVGDLDFRPYHGAAGGTGAETGTRGESQVRRRRLSGGLPVSA